MDDDAPQPPGKAKRPSIKDVAALAGVSWRTVSNVIHGHQYLKPDTKAKVEAAIAELGYRPQLAARQLRSGRSNLVTLAVPYLAHPYFASLAHAVVEAAEERGFTVLVNETRGLPDLEEKVARGYRSVLSDGIIFSPLTMSVDAIVAVRDTTPLVLLGEHTLNSSIDHVSVDNTGSTREATQHLIDLGRKKIAFLGYLSQGSLGTADLRLDGYRQALRAAGLQDAQSLATESPDDLGAREFTVGAERDYSREDGFARAQRLLPFIDDIDAIVCANDLLAVGVLRAFRQAGVRVPEDVAVTGWDNTPEGGFSSPTLTTVAPDMQAIARHAVAAIERRIESPTAEPMGYVAGHRLIVRESTAGVGAGVGAG